MSGETTEIFCSHLRHLPAEFHRSPGCISYCVAIVNESRESRQDHKRNARLLKSDLRSSYLDKTKMGGGCGEMFPESFAGHCVSHCAVSIAVFLYSWIKPVLRLFIRSTVKKISADDLVSYESMTVTIYVDLNFQFSEQS